MLEACGTAVVAARFSVAQTCLAPSTSRRLAMQVVCCAFKRARTKLGMAMVARRPMMATTIMISTRVNPRARLFLFFISCCLLFLQYHWNDKLIATDYKTRARKLSERGM